MFSALEVFISSFTSGNCCNSPSRLNIYPSIYISLAYSISFWRFGAINFTSPFNLLHSHLPSALFSSRLPSFASSFLPLSRLPFFLPLSFLPSFLPHFLPLSFCLTFLLSFPSALLSLPPFLSFCLTLQPICSSHCPLSPFHILYLRLLQVLVWALPLPLLMPLRDQ